MKTLNLAIFPAPRSLAAFRPQLFVHPGTEIVDSDGLAALGISRRPPQLPASSGGTLWSPPFKPAVFARRQASFPPRRLMPWSTPLLSVPTCSDGKVLTRIVHTLLSDEATVSSPFRPTVASARVSGLAFLALAAVLTGCTTIKQTAVDTLGDALAGGGTTFAADDDPQLIAAAVPFSLKLMESLLAERPQHRGLLLAAASGFTQYAFAFVQQDADEVTEKDFAAGTELKHRARRLYLRARDYGLRGLDVAHPGFSQQLRANPSAAVRLAAKSDVPLLYWTAASWGAAISVSKDNADLIADQGILEALIDRAYELDADFDHGAIHALLVTYEMARPGGTGDPAARARRHFDRAMALSQQQQAGPLVSLAESVTVPRQNRAEFEALLKRALALDADARPEFRLINLVMQRRARWLLGRIDELFLPAINSPESAPQA